MKITEVVFLSPIKEKKAYILCDMRGEISIGN